MLRASASSSRFAAGQRPSPSHRRAAAIASANAPSTSSSPSFLAQQLAQKEAELAGLIAPGKAPPPAAVVGLLRDEIATLEAALSGAPPPPTFVSREAAAKARAAVAAPAKAASASAAAVPRLLRPGSSAKYVGGAYGGEDQDGSPPRMAPGGLPEHARRAVPPSPPTPAFELARVAGRMVPWPAAAEGSSGGGSKKKAAAGRKAAV